MTTETCNMFYSRLNYATQLCGNRQDAEDAIHNILLRLVNNEKFEKLNRTEQLNYTLRAIRNEAIEIKRRAKRKHHSLLDRIPVTFSPSVYDRLELNDTIKSIGSRKGLKALLMQAEGYSSDEIAKVYNSNSNAMNAKIFYLRKILKSTLPLLLFFSSPAIAQVQWRQISGPTKTIIKNPNSFVTLASDLKKAGVYSFEFSVKNQFGIARDTCNVTVLKAGSKIPPQKVHPKKEQIKVLGSKDKIMVQYISPRDQNIVVRIYDFTGRKMAETDLKLKEGVNTIDLPRPVLSGFYTLIFNGQKPLSTQLIL